MKTSLLVLIAALSFPFIGGAQAVTPTPTASPTVTPGSAPGTLNVSWSANPAKDNVISYSLYEKVGSTWNRLKLVLAPALTTVLTDVPLGPHTYALTAINQGAESARSDEVSYTVTSLPSAPTGLKIIIIGQ